MERISLLDLRLGLVRLPADKGEELRQRVLPLLARTTIRLQREVQTSAHPPSPSKET